MPEALTTFDLSSAFTKLTPRCARRARPIQDKLAGEFADFRVAEVEPSDVVKLLEIKWAGKATAAKQSRRSIRDINLAAGLLRIGRRVPLNSRADAVLARRGSKRSALVFGTRRWDHYPTAWESAVERAKLVDFHDLRHTFASWAIQRGASLQEVTDILGHHSLAMTLRYGHLAPEPPA